MCRCCICQVLKTLLLIFCLALPHPLPSLESTETVATSVVADPVDLEAMAAEQNRCAETQRLFGVSSLQLAFRQAGTQCLAGDVSTGIFFAPLSHRNSEKTSFYIFTIFHIRGGSPPGYGVF
jgi:hypothetical protein